MDAKRQNKLLKLAIGRLQNELERAGLGSGGGADIANGVG